VSIVGADFSPEMLNEARKHSGEGIEFELADALKLPFADGSFDAVTMSFAARNLNSGEAPLVEYFREINRVIKNGGAFYNLETSRPSNSFIRAMFRAYVGLLVAIIGKKFSGNDEGYKYLAGSILEFMGPDELSRRLKDAGFSQVSYTKILTGAVAIHKAVK
jgi:demethylmenaquinone methyltransferase/2-methoxy-6-polyprenyl-1,4-benzoquinol methylase